MQTEQELCFGLHRLNLQTLQLRRGQQEVKLTPKALAVLRVLVAQPGQIVTKDELFQAVWPQTVVSDDALTTCILELRQALRDNARQPRYIETVHRQGYRFIAPIAPPDTAAPPARSSSFKVQGGEEAQPPALPLPDKPSIAVLPFTNLSSDPEQDYFGDGLTDDLITDVSKIAALFVIARHSVFTYKGKAAKVQEISKELGVRYVLEGSVRKTDDQVRINAQLVDTATGHHLWAERYDRPLQDLFVVQDEISQKIVTALKVKLTAEEQDRFQRAPTNNLEAYDFYLRGLESFFDALYKNETFAQARQMFERAIALDSQYAAAHARLGETYFIDWYLQGNRDHG